eukprot:gene3932-4550_t
MSWSVLGRFPINFNQVFGLTELESPTATSADNVSPEVQKQRENLIAEEARQNEFIGQGTTKRLVDLFSTWSELSGSDKQSSILAFLQSMTIGNLFTMMGHDIFVIEVRNQLGYGLRWDADGQSFRGFLEPQMAAFGSKSLLVVGVAQMGFQQIRQGHDQQHCWSTIVTIQVYASPIAIAIKFNSSDSTPAPQQSPQVSSTKKSPAKRAPKRLSKKSTSAPSILSTDPKKNGTSVMSSTVPIEAISRMNPSPLCKSTPSTIISNSSPMTQDPMSSGSESYVVSAETLNSANSSPTSFPFQSNTTSCIEALGFPTIPTDTSPSSNPTTTTTTTTTTTSTQSTPRKKRTTKKKPEIEVPPVLSIEAPQMVVPEVPDPRFDHVCKTFTGLLGELTPKQTLKFFDYMYTTLTVNYPLHFPPPQHQPQAPQAPTTVPEVKIEKVKIEMDTEMKPTIPLPVQAKRKRAPSKRTTRSLSMPAMTLEDVTNINNRNLSPIALVDINVSSYYYSD